jgi:hypothetical protein
MKQNTQSGTYITIKIPKHNKKYIIYSIKQKHTKHKPYTGLFEMIVGVLTTCHTKYT